MKSGASAHYSTMTMDELCNLPIQKIADENSVLFLWVTCPMQEEGMKLMKSWGYTYKTKIYWRKIMSLGMGFWLRGQVEECWLGVRGNIKAFRLQIPNFVQTKALKHSQKPEGVRKIIEQIALSPRIELFARQKTEGWDVWGNEVESDIDLMNNTKEAEMIYCRGCRWYDPPARDSDGWLRNDCRVVKGAYNSPLRPDEEEIEYAMCSEKNRDNNCPDYQPKPLVRIRERLRRLFK